MKTIKEHLETLPEPYRTQALANTDKDILETDENTLVEALGCCFHWDDSPEGHEYWSNFHSTLTKDVKSVAVEPPTNALSALHAIALKKGFPVEDIISIREVKGRWGYKVKDHEHAEFFVDFKTE